MVAAIALVSACQAQAPAVTESSAPAGSPTARPTIEPTALPTLEPTASPSLRPTAALPTDERSEGWRSDLERLITAREEIHPDPWFGIDRGEYVAAVEAVAARVGQLSDDELLVETVRLAAMPTWNGRDGHGGIFAWSEGDGITVYPLRMYWFSDGLFVVDAMPPNENLVGLRVTSIGGHPVDAVRTVVDDLIPRDNHQQLLSQSPRLMIAPAILHGLGLIDQREGEVDFELSGERGDRSVSLAPVPIEQYRSLAGGHHVLSPPGRVNGARWLRNLERSAWWELDRSSATAYVGYNRVDYQSQAIASEIADALDAGDIERLIIDLRHNPGGDNTTYGALLSVVRRAAEELPGGVYVAIGRVTFSAAGNFATDIEATTDATFVGEDMGSSPNLYGDVRVLHLPHSGLTLRVATRYWMKSDADDPRVTIEPDIEAMLTSTDYFGDRDPVIEAIRVNAE